MRCLCLLALSVSAYLVWVALTSSPVYGCGGEVFDCGHVLSSGWSKWFGIPVSVPAFALYASLLSVLAFMRTNAPPRLLFHGWQMMTAGAVAAGTAALWFIGLQIFAVGRVCIYCVAAHLCGLALATLMLWIRPLGRRQTGLMCSVGLLAAFSLIGGQLLTPAEPTWVVERFDQFNPSGQSNPSGQLNPAESSALGDELVPAAVFGAPDDAVFGAPDDVAEPDVFAPPQSDTASADSSRTPADSPDAGSPAPGGSAADVAASLLILLPAGQPFIDRLLFQNPGDTKTGPSESADHSDSGTPADTRTSADTGTPEEAAPQPAEPRIISAAGDKFRLNIRQWPLLGNPEAKYVFVEMFDYTCPHCRNTHLAIKQAFRRYGGDLAVVALVVPLHPNCNKASRSGNSQNADSCELARLAVAVWRVRPADFMSYHDWMFEGGRNRTAAEARKHAEMLVCAEQLQNELARRTVGEYISRHVELYQKVGSGSVPKLLFPRSVMTGEVSSATALTQMIEREIITR